MDGRGGGQPLRWDHLPPGWASPVTPRHAARVSFGSKLPRMGPVPGAGGAAALGMGHPLPAACAGVPTLLPSAGTGRVGTSSRAWHAKPVSEN